MQSGVDNRINTNRVDEKKSVRQNPGFSNAIFQVPCICVNGSDIFSFLVFLRVFQDFLEPFAKYSTIWVVVLATEFCLWCKYSIWCIVMIPSPLCINNIFRAVVIECGMEDRVLGTLELIKLFFTKLRNSGIVESDVSPILLILLLQMLNPFWGIWQD